MRDTTGLVMVVVVFASVMSIVATAIQAFELRDCTATNETRPGHSSFVMSGNVMIPVIRTERRYICPDGLERWR